MKLGFIGLGNMGSPMAMLLARSANDLIAFDVDEQAVDKFLQSAQAAAGGSVAKAASPAQVGANADIVGICVRDAAQVDDVLFGPAGLVAALASGSVVLVHSTIQAADVRRFAARAAEKGVTVLESAVTRSRRDHSQPFVASIMGGDAETVDAVRPVLEIFSSKIVHAGPLGAGMGLKAANNLVTFLAYVGMAEGHRLAMAADADPDKLDVLMTENGNLTPMMQGLLNQRANADLQTRAGLVKLMEKDIDVALEIAESSGITLAATKLARSLISDAVTGEW